jgi:hypothetical protein
MWKARAVLLLHFIKPTDDAFPTVSFMNTPTSTPYKSQVHDSLYDTFTDFRRDPSFDAFYQAHGRRDSFGDVISRPFRLLGCQVQMFQRAIMQDCSGTGSPIQLMNILDPELMPYTPINGSNYPSVDPATKQATPIVGEPNYTPDMNAFLTTHVSDSGLSGAPVNFATTFTRLGGLDILGAPTSSQLTDQGFVYQRFQRGILQYGPFQGSQVTQAVLLADYFKQIIQDDPALIPRDLETEAMGTGFFSQYCEGYANWICTPADLDLGSNDLTGAFVPG